MTAPKAEVLRAYLNAPSPDSWLTSELRSSLADELGDADAVLLVGTARERAGTELEEFLASQVEPHEVISTIVVFARPGGTEEEALGGVFRSSPSPLALLELATEGCEPLDEVVVTQTFASGQSLTHSHTWPFGLSESVDLLTPGLALVPEDDDVLL
jgi:hypothetical protein